MKDQSITGIQIDAKSVIDSLLDVQSEEVVEIDASGRWVEITYQYMGEIYSNGYDEAAMLEDVYVVTKCEFAEAFAQAVQSRLVEAKKEAKTRRAKEHLDFLKRMREKRESEVAR